MSFRDFLAQTDVTYDPAGNLIADMRSDRDLPLLQDIRAARSYLRGRGARRGAIEAFPTFGGVTSNGARTILERTPRLTLAQQQRRQHLLGLISDGARRSLDGRQSD
jgi:hypothetical protein